MNLNIKYTTDVIKGGAIVGFFFPAFMRVLATHYFTKIPRNIARGVQLLGPLIKERVRYMNEYGPEWEDKPNDLLSWMMEQAQGQEMTPKRLTNRILFVNFTAVHTTANLLTQALCFLAKNPQYIEPLRKEVESIVNEDGWSKSALSKMRKVDSFLKECQRTEGLNIDETVISKGTSIAAAALFLHHDGKFYENPNEFQPFRFANIPEEDGMGARYQFASTTTEYIPFGHGKPACPGRFFAADELKSMLAHTVVAYDMKLEDNVVVPTSWRMGTLMAGDPNARIMFRNRNN